MTINNDLRGAIITANEKRRDVRFGEVDGGSEIGKFENVFRLVYENIIYSEER